MREQRIENREPFNPTQGKQEEKPTTQIPAKSPEIKLPQPQMEPEKEPPAPMVSPIIRGFGATESREKRVESREEVISNKQQAISISEQVTSNNQQTPIIPVAPAPSSTSAVPAYYQQAKQEAEREIAKLERIETRDTSIPEKILLPTGPSPYVITKQELNGGVNNGIKNPWPSAEGEQRARQVSSIKEVPKTTSTPQANTKPSLILPSPSSSPIISVTPPGVVEGTKDQALGTGGEQRIGNSPNAPSVTNPLRIEKKIPKPPAPEKYDADPYKEPIE
jgi:hypothetical protein